MNEVYRGSRWLDTFLPGWHNKVDINNISKLVEQLFGSYEFLLQLHDEIWCKNYGFIDGKEWIEHIIFRRLFVYSIYNYNNMYRMSISTVKNRNNWVDMGVVLEDNEINERMLTPKKFISGVVWNNLF